MTTPDPLVAPPATKTLPITLDGDLVVDFRNRDPANAAAYLDYPPGVVGVFTIYTDLAEPGVERITATADPDGYHMLIRIPAAQLNSVKDLTLWGYRVRYPDPGFVDGFYDRPIVAGEVQRADGRAAL
ncbi:hypothetical protein [Nocardia sp. NPDC057455]|uniref:LtfC-like domain-containing protein n=1 Tax=Nocardia sp. NPDC057455 TaxID=3346138 RepID=UPI0036709240